MKRKLLALIIGILMIGGNVHAADGDMVVSGNLTVGGTITAGSGIGVIQQVIIQQYTSTTTSSATIPVDATKPQSNEGTEIMTLAITPTNSSNKLVVEVEAFLEVGAEADWMIMALFKDSGADAICTTVNAQNYGVGGGACRLRYVMTAGTTNSITFKVRAGSAFGNTWGFNCWSNGAAMFGGTLTSSIKITEIEA